MLQKSYYAGGLKQPFETSAVALLHNVEYKILIHMATKVHSYSASRHLVFFNNFLSTNSFNQLFQNYIYFYN